MLRFLLKELTFNLGFQHKWILLARSCEPCILLKFARNSAQFENSCAQFRAIARNGIAIGNPIWVSSSYSTVFEKIIFSQLILFRLVYLVFSGIRG